MFSVELLRYSATTYRRGQEHRMTRMQQGHKRKAINDKLTFSIKKINCKCEIMKTQERVVLGM